MELPWLPLRQELNLFAGADEAQGAPTWVLQDPASQRFFRFDYVSMEMLKRWHLADPERIAQAIEAETCFSVDADEVRALQQRLYQWELLQLADPALRQHWARRPTGQSAWRWLLSHYLFFRVPLLRPQALLNRIGPWFGFVFGSGFWGLTLLAALLGLYLTSQQWSHFWSTFAAYSDWSGALYLFLALSLVKVLHEFGHALTTHHFGCRVPTMGIAFLVMWPVLYTDTSEAWTLKSRRQRMAIGAAGMAAEIAVAAWATLAWHIAPDGPLRTALFFLSTTAWVMSLMINLSPLMRFDGYFLLCDAVNQPNLHARAFEFGRWWLRQHWWGIPDAKPEDLNRTETRWMVLFAFAVWIYRFFLFFGIALLVYHLFFKVLGLFLMLVEVGVFIVRPLINELVLWWQRRSQMRGWRRLRTLLVLAVLITPLVMPWSASLKLAATFGAELERNVFVPLSGQLQQLAVQEGQQVQAGDLIALFDSPELNQELEQVRQERQLLQWQLTRQGFDSELLAQGQSLSRRLDESLSRELALTTELGRLRIVAPVAGQVVDMPTDLKSGDWLSKDSFLLRLISSEQQGVRAYIAEDELMRLGSLDKAVFVPESPELAQVECRFKQIDESAISSLDDLPLASEFGGSIPVRRSQTRLAPEGAWYRIQFDHCPALGLLARVRGTLHLPVRPESLIAGAWRRAKAILIRESGMGQ